MSIDLHLVSSPSTAGSLRRAIKDELLSGEVFCTMDIPELGPLANGIQRMKFLMIIYFLKIVRLSGFRLQEL
ncbi:hypothetical protein [Pedobacter sp. UYP1]|jgi:hypothetical protein|uniref:hypothetical protein n=1 Tax=Pedobacter sp. UYP1 TaxID=1756396 RepID=UPI0033928C8C